MVKKLLDKKGTYEINKIALSCFDDKIYALDYEIHPLAYFEKDSVTSYKEIKKDCDGWKRLWWLKKIVLVIRWIFSSNINEGIKAVLFFLWKDFAPTK